MDGFEFVRKLKEINSTTKVLLMSAFEINSAELSTALGSVKINGFIQKPLSLKELKSIIRKLILMKLKLVYEIIKINALNTDEFSEIFRIHVNSTLSILMMPIQYLMQAPYQYHYIFVYPDLKCIKRSEYN